MRFCFGVLSLAATLLLLVGCEGAEYTIVPTGRGALWLIFGLGALVLGVIGFVTRVVNRNSEYVSAVYRFVGEADAAARGLLPGWYLEADRYMDERGARVLMLPGAGWYKYVEAGWYRIRMLERSPGDADKYVGEADAAAWGLPGAGWYKYVEAGWYLSGDEHVGTYEYVGEAVVPALLLPAAGWYRTADLDKWRRRVRGERD